ncbi:PaaI family thioesterase [Murdochiella vaginalis]|uniref:PaaI family thioesterase n=1 Tax=Murdochiella vaginalis TaxID=1852373 RepID=UPI0008FE54D2|nr:PaaI family thioesterase [Murdochiella vaginalis]
MEISRELFDRLVDLRRTTNRFMIEAGIEITEAEEGTATTKLVTSEQKHQNPQGVVQGGVLMTMADAAMATALVSFNDAVATVDMNYHFLGAVHSGDTVICRATIIKAGRKVVVTEAMLYVEERLIGRATATFLRSGRKMIEE